jgi:hypothetical protein
LYIRQGRKHEGLAGEIPHFSSGQEVMEMTIKACKNWIALVFIGLALGGCGGSSDTDSNSNFAGSESSNTSF